MTAADGLDSASGSRRVLDQRGHLVNAARSQDVNGDGLLVPPPVLPGHSGLVPPPSGQSHKTGNAAGPRRPVDAARSLIRVTFRLSLLGGSGDACRHQPSPPDRCGVFRCSAEVLPGSSACSTPVRNWLTSSGTKA